MKNDILSFIEKRQHVSMVELCREIPGFSGDLEWYINTNTVIWSSVSKEAIQAMNELMKSQMIIPIITAPLVYMVDGAMLNYPIAKSQTVNYKTPRWMSVVFSTKKQVIKDKQRWKNRIKN